MEDMREKDGRLIFVGRLPAGFFEAIESIFSCRSINSIENTSKVLVSNDICCDTVINAEDNKK
jgi:hypothetical protein